MKKLILIVVSLVLAGAFFYMGLDMGYGWKTYKETGRTNGKVLEVIFNQ